jgi:Zn-dependent membrane protease YugP
MLIVITLGIMLVSWIVSSRLKSKFKKYSLMGLSSNLTGREIAEMMLRDNGIYDVRVISVDGELTDHYNPVNKTVNLSPDVYHGRSAAAAAVAAHECGHAIQHATAYAFLEFRSAMVPVQNISSTVINVVFMMMMFGAFFFKSILPLETALLIIIACYSVMTLFAFVTLPVEFDASKRALAWIDKRGIVTSREHDMAKDALNTAAMTYVIAALGSLITLMYFVLQYLGASRE